MKPTVDPKCNPLAVFCERCLQPKGEGCRDLARRTIGSCAPVPLLPVGIFHGIRIADAQAIVRDLKRERSTSSDFKIRPTPRFRGDAGKS